MLKLNLSNEPVWLDLGHPNATPRWSVFDLVSTEFDQVPYRLNLDGQSMRKTRAKTVDETPVN